MQSNLILSLLTLAIHAFHRVSAHKLVGEKSNAPPIDNEHDPTSTRITNDVKWFDENNNEIAAGYGGKITKLNGVWYWVGTPPTKSTAVSLNCTSR